MAPPLPEELVVDEALVRFPPDDPASLVRAALVSTRWCRLISGAHHGFSRRYRDLHRSPPLLGFLCNRFHAAGARFVPTSSFHRRLRPPSADRHRDWRAVHSCHGRVLLHDASYSWSDGDYRDNDLLVVWDPITDEQRELPSRRGAAYPCGTGTRLCSMLQLQVQAAAATISAATVALSSSSSWGLSTGKHSPVSTHPRLMGGASLSLNGFPIMVSILGASVLSLGIRTTSCTNCAAESSSMIY
ncbi:hypothetical protein C2845_PM04G01290 [Panicum miliaceum]|uniref:F-box domain-containing protein n=1 Tax=Panicum miliaceum TaxID=4540 RepID=A0A3L6QQE8_PANMI|nr:hypothetical protein C2845_PM04G01290 [Panicum miliaceum]